MSRPDVRAVVMAARNTPAKGNKPDKLFRDALMLVLNREDMDEGKKVKKINKLAAMLVTKGLEGDTQAIKEIRDTVDGKPSQSIGLGQAEDLKPLEANIRPPMTRDEWLKLHG